MVSSTISACWFHSLIFGHGMLIHTWQAHQIAEVVCRSFDAMMAGWAKWIAAASIFPTAHFRLGGILGAISEQLKDQPRFGICAHICATFHHWNFIFNLQSSGEGGRSIRMSCENSVVPVLPCCPEVFTVQVRFEGCKRKVPCLPCPGTTAILGSEGWHKLGPFFQMAGKKDPEFSLPHDVLAIGITFFYSTDLSWG